jgi:hypothetical protein
MFEICLELFGSYWTHKSLDFTQNFRMLESCLKLFELTWTQKKFGVYSEL